MSRNTLLLVSILALAAPVARAQSSLRVTPVDTSQVDAVVVRVDIHYVWHWDESCFEIPFDCGSAGVSIRIEPCPPLVPCQADSTTIRYSSLNPSFTLVLAVGESYEFSGTWWFEKLDPIRCEVPICWDGESFDPVVFPEPDVPIHSACWSTIKRLYH